MGIPRYDTGLCYDAASAPDRKRLAGPAVDTPPASWSNPSTNEPWNPTDRGPTVEEWNTTTDPAYGGGAVSGTKVTGTGDTITKDTPSAGYVTLDDAGGAFVVAMEQGSIRISGATNPNNNGLFPITAVNSATQLVYWNRDAVTVTESFTYGINQADAGYGAGGTPTESWRYDVDLPSGWYTRTTTSKQHSGQQ